MIGIRVDVFAMSFLYPVVPSFLKAYLSPTQFKETNCVAEQTGPVRAIIQNSNDESSRRTIHDFIEI